MKLDNRRVSDNLDDRRGGKSSVTKASGLGIGGIIVVALISLMLGGNPLDVVQNLSQQEQTTTTTNTEQFSAEEQELAKFSGQILAGLEDVWTEIFKQNGLKYIPPKLVLYTNSIKTACGNGSASSGPFYCSGDQCVYIDLSFFMQMKNTLGADGDFAYAYVIAHEVGHHVQYLLGTLDQANQQMARVSEKEANKISVRLELQADFYAGVWAYHDNKKYKSLEEGDIEEALQCAAVIGDNYLQEKARGYSQPETFTHGTSEQRSKWLKYGLSTGDVTKGNTFAYSDNDL